MEWPPVWPTAAAGATAGTLVLSQSVCLHLPVHLGARYDAALPLRPTDGVWLEVSAAAIPCESDHYSIRGCGESIADASIPISRVRSGLHRGRGEPAPADAPDPARAVSDRGDGRAGG